MTRNEHPAPTGRQHEIRRAEQVAVIAEVGATLRCFSTGGVDVIDGFPADERSSAGREQVLAALDEPELGNALRAGGRRSRSNGKIEA